MRCLLPHDHHRAHTHMGVRVRVGENMGIPAWVARVWKQLWSDAGGNGAC